MHRLKQKKQFRFSALAQDKDDNNLVSLRNLVVHDPTALQKWGTLVDHIVQLPEDKQRINDLLDKGTYERAVLDSIRLWDGLGDDRADLIKVFRDHGLNSLAGILRLQVS